MRNKSMILVKMPVIISSGFVYFSEDERVVSFFFFVFFLNPLFPFFYLFIYLLLIFIYVFDLVWSSSLNKQSLKILLNLTSSSDYAGKVKKSYFFFLFSYNCETKSLIRLMSGSGGVVITKLFQRQTNE